MKLAALSAMAIALMVVSATAQTEVISPTATWDYLHTTDGSDPAASDPSSDFATTWHGYAGYDGPPFVANQPGPFSYGGITYFTNNAATLPGTLIGVGGTATAPPTGSRYTAYFKKQFTTTGNYANATVRLLADDGAVIYLDGVEVRRINMTGGGNDQNNGSGDTYTMLADEFTDEAVFTSDFSIGAISAGTHVIAVSLHNSDTGSSDLGLYFQLFGSPPPTVMMRTEFGGVFTDVLTDAILTGWKKDSPPLSFRLNGDGAATLNSLPINLSAAGEVYFTAQLYIYEASATSNFEAEDSFGAKLEITRDDDTIIELNLLPDDLDTNLDSLITGDELNPGLPPVEDAVCFGRELRGIIPADAKSVRVLISGDNDSTSEEFDIGGMLLSDVPPGSDADGDGMAREAEMFAQTDPNDPLSHLRIKAIDRVVNTTTGEIDYTITHPGVANMWYAVEYSRDGIIWELSEISRPPVTNPDRQVVVSLTTAEDPGDKIMIRIRAEP